MRPLSIAILTVITFSTTAPVVAQEVPTDLPEINAEDVSMGQIVSFVNAMIAAERVRKDYLQKIDAAETEEEINDLLAEADKEGMAAVDNVAGISTAEYMAIALAAKEDEELAARIQKRIATLAKAQRVPVVTKPANGPESEAAE